jgi:Flp pilus assembly protein TadG
VLTTNSEIRTRRASRRSHKLESFGARLCFRICTLTSTVVSCVRDAEAAELLEFALALPMILVMVVGLLDFARAYNLKQKLANAAREGARLQASQIDDRTNSNPATVQDTYNDVVTYLNDANVNTSFIGTTLSYDPCPGTCTGTYYTTSGGVNYGLEIERNVLIVDSSGTTLHSTRVTLYYPYDWTFGFNQIIKLLVPSSTFTNPIRIQTDATMQNIG